MIDAQQSDDVIFWVLVAIILTELGLLALGLNLVPPDSQVVL